jgi:hypothetical protein
MVKSNSFLSPPIVNVTTAADALTQVAIQKAKAGKLTPGRDASAENARKVGKTWTDGDTGGQHTPGQ